MDYCLSFRRSKQSRCCVVVIPCILRWGPVVDRDGITVDIFDNIKGSWSVASLSGGRTTLVAASYATRAFFGGAGTDVIDIYDAFTSTWGVAALARAPTWGIAVSLPLAVMFAGGWLGDGLYTRAAEFFGQCAPGHARTKLERYLWNLPHLKRFAWPWNARMYSMRPWQIQQPGGTDVLSCMWPRAVPAERRQQLLQFLSAWHVHP